jgi:uncharacterized protein
MPLPAPTHQTTALVTGASSGIGRELARGLAGRGHGVTLVARREERLEALAEELRARHGVRVEVLADDLSDAGACDRILSHLDDLGLEVDVLANNAGFGIYSAFAASDPHRELEQIDVLVRAVVHFNAHVLPRMVERGRGAIINVSSTAGFQPLPGNGTYAACKAFVLWHSEALSSEVKGTGVTVTAVCPGPVRTEFQETSEPLFSERLPGFVWTTAERVARDALRAVEEGRRTVIPGGLATRAFFGPNRMAPAALALPIASKLMSREVERGRAAGSGGSG